MNLNIKTDYNIYTNNNTKASILLNLKAKKMNDDDKSDIGIILVADKSGSMYGNKFELLKEAINKIIVNLSTNDIFGLVTFDNIVNKDFSTDFMNDENKLKIKNIVEKLEVGATTNLSGGLFNAIEQINNYKKLNKEDTRSWNILLLTDGIANEGIVNPVVLGNQINKLIDSNPLISNISIYTFGLGIDHNSDLLKNISNSTNSNYYYLENKDMIATAFGDCLGGLLSVVVQNLEINLESFKNYNIEKIYTNYKIKDNKIYIGDLYSEEEKNIIIDISCNNIDTENILIDNCIKLNLKYIDLIDTTIINSTINSTINRDSTIQKVILNNDVLIQKCRLKAINIMNTMMSLNLIELEKIIKDFKTTLEDHDLIDDIYCKDLLNKMNNYLEKSKVDKTSALHTLRSNVQQVCIERAATSDISTPTIFSTGRKNNLAKAFSNN